MAQNSRISTYFLPEQIQNALFEQNFDLYFWSLWDTLIYGSLNLVGPNKADLY